VERQITSLNPSHMKKFSFAPHRKLDGRITSATFCKRELSVVTTRYVSESYVSYLELFRPVLNQELVPQNYDLVVAKEVEAPVSCLVTFSQSSSPCDGVFLATKNGSLNVYDLDEATVRETSSILNGHNGPVVALDYCSKNKLLFSGGSDGLIKAWDVRCFGRKGEALGFVPILSDHCCCITHCGTDDPYKVFVGTQKGYVCLYDTRFHRKDPVEKVSLPDSISNMFAVATSVLVVSTFYQVYKVNLLLARNNILYQNDERVLVGIGSSHLENYKIQIADEAKRLLLVDCKTGSLEKDWQLQGKSYWTRVEWHSFLPIYLASSYKSFEVGVFPSPYNTAY